MAVVTHLQNLDSATVGSHTRLFTAMMYLASLQFWVMMALIIFNAASIEAEVDGTPGANDMPGRLVFSTTADGASSPTERMRITSDGVTSIQPTRSLLLSTPLQH